MILAKPSYKILDTINTNEILKTIEFAGRICYKSETKINNYSAKQFVATIIKRGHESVIEHRQISVKFICDRGISHEIVRHRIGSYSQESTRYCDYNKNKHLCFIIPCWTKNIQQGIYTTQSITTTLNSNLLGLNNDEICWIRYMIDIESMYKNLRQQSWLPEQARSVLPNSLKTEIIVTYNLRQWRHFFKLRMSPKAHPQMREIVKPLFAEFKQKLPIIFRYKE